MNKADLVTAVSATAGMTKKESQKAIDAITAAITAALSNGETVRLMGFGTFQIKERAARRGLNPKTKEQINIPPSKAPVFKPSNSLKEYIS